MERDEPLPSQVVPIPNYVNRAYMEQMEDQEAESSWNEANENLVTYYALHAKHMMKKHSKMYERMNRIHKILMYPTIALTTVSGVVNYNEDHPIIKYFTSSVSIISAILISYVKFMKLGELIEAHARTSTLYKLLYRRMIGELLRDSSERVHANIFIQDVSLQFDDLIKISPSVPENLHVSSSGYNHWALSKLLSDTNPRPSKTILYRAFYRWRRCTVIRKIVQEDIEMGNMFGALSPQSSPESKQGSESASSKGPIPRRSSPSMDTY